MEYSDARHCEVRLQSSAVRVLTVLSVSADLLEYPQFSREASVGMLVFVEERLPQCAKLDRKIAHVCSFAQSSKLLERGTFNLKRSELYCVSLGLKLHCRKDSSLQ